jgi:hypothetical protein
MKRSVNFVVPSAKTVDEMIMSLPRNEQAIVKRLRDLVLECLPFAIEKPYYGLGVPYYSRHRQICYILPSSALCGTEDMDSENGSVTLGFCQGNRMSDDEGILKAEGRKQVRVMYFHTLRDISEDQVRPLLFEAAMIDEAVGRGGKGKR